MAAKATAATNLAGAETALLLIIEGLTQTWPLRGAEAVTAAQRLARAMAEDMLGTLA